MGNANVGNLGRQWGIQELRERSWEDLHGLWHVCVRERNRIATSDFERERIQAGYGGFESQERDKVVSFSPGCISRLVHLYILERSIKTFSSLLPRRSSIG